jgi:SNF2-related domain/Helicase conserved C-terminal domain/SWIM zinc finger
MLDRLRQIFGQKTYDRGYGYFHSGKVVAVKKAASGLVMATVRGGESKPYKQRIEIARSRGGEVQNVKASCTCPVGYNCKHVAAALIYLERNPGFVEQAKEPLLSPALMGWLEQVRQAEKAAAPKPEAARKPAAQHVFFVADVNAEGKFEIAAMLSSTLKDGSISKSAQRFDTASLSWREPPAGMSAADIRLMKTIAFLGLAPTAYSSTRAEPQHGEVLDLLATIAATGRGHWGKHTGPRLAPGGTIIGRFAWRGLADGSQTMVLEDEAGSVIEALRLEPLAWINPATGAFGELMLDAPRDLALALLSGPPVPADAAPEVAAALGGLSIARPPLPEKLKAEIRENETPVPVLKLFGLPATRRSRGWGYGKPAADEKLALAMLRLSFDYRGRILPVKPRDDVRYREGDKAIVLRRNIKAEDAAFECLDRLSLSDVEFLDGLQKVKGAQENDRAFLDFEDLGDRFDDDLYEDAGHHGADIVLRFMTVTLPELREAGWRIEIAPDWPYRVHEGPANIVARAGATGKDWFSFGLTLEADGLAVDLVPLLTSIIAVLPLDEFGALEADFDIAALLEDMPLYQRLASGAYASLDPDQLAPLVRVFLDFNALLNGFHPAEAGRVSALAEALAGCSVPFEGGARLMALGQKLRALADAPEATPPASLKADLRPYQKTGYGWLRALAETGFGGVLADDMGLGKTVQTLALLAELHLEQKAERPSLLVVPTSLVGTWAREAARFAPGLEMLVLHGGDRHGRFESIGGHHVCITTYPLLVRDQDKLFAQAWRAVILDEAQNAKNPASNAAKCIRLADADFRLALTGTPMENTLEDLWTLFDWLIPGLLGDRKGFRKNFRNPIEQSGDKAVQAHLNARLRPFMLRRSKSEVAAELPEKTVITESIALGDKQRALYETIRLSMDKRVREAIAAKGLAASRITILAALLRLRQVCCDPALLPEGKGIESAKRARLLEMLESLVAEGRRLVVFSQFVEMLKLIEVDVKARGWNYEWLTGDTVDRDGAIDRFQKGSAPLFLVSLKAGGTGLTLTAADTVILYDPWWNPAVERQAMDRVHRIGQDKPVFIHRLIAEGAVEEAIVKLQERKQALTDALFEGGPGGTLELGEDDIDMLFRPIKAGGR